MSIKVYLPGGEAESLFIPEGQDPLDVIFLEYGFYCEYDLI
jgi:hypothetical protein